MKFLAGIAIMFVIFVGYTVTHDGSSSRGAAQPVVQAASPSQTADLAARVAPYEIIASCGKPASQWRKNDGAGLYEGGSMHFWYPKVPAEIMLVGEPGGPNEQGSYWTFLGGFPSRGANDMYDEAKLAKKMPCVAKWANAVQPAVSH